MQGARPSATLAARRWHARAAVLQPSRTAAPVLLAADDGAPEPEAADAEEDGSDGAAAKPATDDEDDEEEEDLLNSVAFLKQKLKVLEKELAETTAKTAEFEAQAATVAEEWSAKRTRLATDFDNFKARAYNQTMEAQLDARVKLLQGFLPLLDNFDRARGLVAPDGEAQRALSARYEAAHASLMAALEGMGVAKIETVGAEFDYNLHQAIQQVPSEYDEGIVAAEMQTGYTCEGQLLRAAYVAVSSGTM